MLIYCVLNSIIFAPKNIEDMFNRVLRKSIHKIVEGINIIIQLSDPIPKQHSFSHDLQLLSQSHLSKSVLLFINY
jgi:hypothetical protein